MSLTKPCKQCGNDFEKKPTISMKSWTEGTKFCSKSCYTESQQGHDPMIGKVVHRTSRKGMKFPDLQGANNPTWSQVQKSCLQCNSQFTVKKYRAETAKFCCHRCSTDNRNEGKTKANEAARKTAGYKDWRKAVYERDNYTCVLCDARGVELHADHIKQFATHVDLRLDVDNGRTLCVPCHKATPTYGRRVAVVTEA